MTESYRFIIETELELELDDSPIHFSVDIAVELEVEVIDGNVVEGVYLTNNVPEIIFVQVCDQHGKNNHTLDDSELLKTPWLQKLLLNAFTERFEQGYRVHRQAVDIAKERLRERLEEANAR